MAMSQKAVDLSIRIFCNIATVALGVLLIDNWWEAFGFIALILVITLNCVVVMAAQEEQKAAARDAAKYRAGLAKEGPW